MDATDLFEQDASLQGQYWNTFARSRDLDPEKRLLAAVLDDAIKNYRAFVVAGGRRFIEDERWLFNDDNREPFSFRNICDILGLSPSRIRQSLRAWKSAGAPSPSTQPVSPRIKKAAAHAARTNRPASFA